MMRNLIVLTLNDLAVSFKNKTLYLMVFIPLFVFSALTMVDRPEMRMAPTKIGIIRDAVYAKEIVASMEASPKLFQTTWLSSEADGRVKLRDKILDGVLLPEAVSSQSAILLVSKKDSIASFATLEGLTQLQREAEGRAKVGWISAVISLEKAQGIQSQTLPIWILMMILLVGLLVVPPQVAEEKEKKLLLGLLQTPMREWAWILAKVLMGMSLAILSSSILHIVSGFPLGDPSYLLFLVAGSFCFSSMGVLLGFTCRTQASARTLGVVFYLPQLLPSALSDVSEKLSTVAVFVPSYQFFAPVKAILLEEAAAGRFVWQLAYLFVVGMMCCGAAQALLKRRWLM